MSKIAKPMFIQRRTTVSPSFTLELSGQRLRYPLHPVEFRVQAMPGTRMNVILASWTAQSAEVLLAIPLENAARSVRGRGILHVVQVRLGGTDEARQEGQCGQGQQESTTVHHFG